MLTVQKSGCPKDNKLPVRINLHILKNIVVLWGGGGEKLPGEKNNINKDKIFLVVEGGGEGICCLGKKFLLRI